MCGMLGYRCASQETNNDIKKENTAYFSLIWEPNPDNLQGKRTLRISRGWNRNKISPVVLEVIICSFVLCFGNLINFIDWFIVPGESPFSSSKEKEMLSS